MAPAAIDALDWGWRHAGRRAAAVAGLDLAIAPGERVLLLGASGSGKSTLLQGLAGVLGDEEEGEASGRLLVDGAPARAARGRAGLLLQDPETQVVLGRAGDDVAFGCENLGVPRDEIWRRVPASLEAVGLDLPLDHPTAALSGGQKQRLALAGILAMRPGLILLDEPTANIDPDGVGEVRDAVARAVADRSSTLVVVEHRVAAWKDLVDRVVVLGEAGTLLADGPPDRVLAEEAARLDEAGVWTPTTPLPAASRAPAPGPPLLTARALEVRRPGAAPAAAGIDLEVRARTALAVTGPNGAGKSTLALTLGGLVPPSAGALRAEEALAAGAGPQPASWRSRQLLTRIGSVFQTPEHQFLAPTVRRELAVGPQALRLPEREAEERVDALLERLDLTALASANPFTLSGGQKRRLSVATVLATRPRVLVLDEPTFGQDARTWRSLVALLSELRDAGHGLVAVTHDDRFVRALGARRLRLGADGRPAARAEAGR